MQRWRIVQGDIYLISGIAGILSGLPGGIGVNEAASTIMLQNEGLPGVISFVISLITNSFK